MLKKAIAGWNAAPGAPADWDPARDGDCGALPIRYWPRNTRLDGSAPRVRWCESAWEPTPRELEQLLAGGQVVLRVHGWQVPVALYVEARHPHAEPDAQPVLAPKPITVSSATYNEVRRLLIADGNAGTFERRDGQEAIDLTGVCIVHEPPPSGP